MSLGECKHGNRNCWQCACERERIENERLRSSLAECQKERDFYKSQFQAKAERNGQNVIERDKAKEQAGVWLNATADARLEIVKLRAELSDAKFLLDHSAKLVMPGEMDSAEALLAFVNKLRQDLDLAQKDADLMRRLYEREASFVPTELADAEAKLAQSELARLKLVAALVLHGDESEYSQKAICAAIASDSATPNEVRDVIREVQEALDWYADKDTWRHAESDELNAEGGFFPYDVSICPIASDNGKRARDALSKLKGVSGVPGTVGGK